MHQGIGPAEMARHRQHDAECLFGDGHRIRSWRVHDRDAFARRGLKINVVHAYAGAPDDAKFFGMLQQSGVHLYGGANYQRVRVFQLRGKLAIQLIGGD
jgi:hypothetical protein